MIFPVITSPSCWGHCGIRYDSIQDVPYPPCLFYSFREASAGNTCVWWREQPGTVCVCLCVCVQEGNTQHDQKRTEYGELTGDCEGS